MSILKHLCFYFLFELARTKIKAGDITLGLEFINADLFVNIFKFGEYFFKMAVYLFKFTVNLLKPTIYFFKSLIYLLKSSIDLFKLAIHLLGHRLEPFFNHNGQIADSAIDLLVYLGTDFCANLFYRLIKHPLCYRCVTIIVFVFHTTILIFAK